MSDDLVKRLREVSLEKRQEAWGRLDGGQDLTIGAMLAEEAADRIQELEAKLAKAVETLGVLADDTNWFDAIEEDGTLSPAWRGTGSPDEIARTTLAELTGGNDE